MYLLWHFHTFVVFIAPNLVYLHNLHINKVGRSVLLHLRHFSSLCDAHIWSYKASKAQEMGENLLNLASAQRG